MVRKFGFCRDSDKKARYYHFMLSPEISSVGPGGDFIMFHRVCYHYHFPHEECMSSLSEMNSTRVQILSQWEDSFLSSFHTLISSYHRSIKEKSLGRNPKPPPIPE